MPRHALLTGPSTHATAHAAPLRASIGRSCQLLQLALLSVSHCTVHPRTELSCRRHHQEGGSALLTQPYLSTLVPSPPHAAAPHRMAAVSIAPAPTCDAPGMADTALPRPKARDSGNVLGDAQRRNSLFAAPARSLSLGSLHSVGVCRSRFTRGISRTPWTGGLRGVG